MKAYHIDRYNLFKENTLINLLNINISPDYLQAVLDKDYPEGISMHGNKYYCSQTDDPEQIKDMFTENIFEYERKTKFPHLPSRFQSIFASETHQETAYWLSRLQPISNITLWEIEFDHGNYVKLDASWLGFDANKPSFPAATYLAESYWSGKHFSETPQWELIIKLPIRVVRSVHLSDIPILQQKNS